MQTTSFKPLAGRKIVVTRPVEEAEVLSEKLRGLGATTVELSTIKIIPPEQLELLNHAVKKLEEYDWVVFTSIHGVRSLTDRMVALKVPLGALAKPKVAAIGPATASELTKHGRSPDFVPREYLSEKIADSLGDLSGKRVLLPRADIASPILPTELRKRGAIVDEVAAYRTVIPEDLTAERVRMVLSKGVDLVTFTSPSTVRNLASVVGSEELLSYLRGAKVGCIGPVTCEAARELGITVDLVAETHTVNALVEAIVNEIRNL